MRNFIAFLKLQVLPPRGLRLPRYLIPEDGSEAVMGSSAANYGPLCLAKMDGGPGEYLLDRLVWMLGRPVLGSLALASLTLWS